METGLKLYTATLIFIMIVSNLITAIFNEKKSSRIASFIALVMYLPMIYYFIRF